MNSATRQTRSSSSSANTVRPRSAYTHSLPASATVPSALSSRSAGSPSCCRTCAGVPANGGSPIATSHTSDDSGDTQTSASTSVPASAPYRTSALRSPIPAIAGASPGASTAGSRSAGCVPAGRPVPRGQVAVAQPGDRVRRAAHGVATGDARIMSTSPSR